MIVLWWISVICIIVGFIGTLYFSLKLQGSLKRLGESIKEERASRQRVTNILVRYIEQLCAVIKTLDTHRVVPDLHEVPSQIAELYQEEEAA
jgi:hypothetical protein